MSFNHLPPQAYSKETLIQAYNWLRYQPPQVQELAKTTDMLISLFTKAQMHGDSYMNRTHMQTFKTELKSLANMMGEFDPAKQEASALLSQKQIITQTHQQQQTTPQSQSQSQSLSQQQQLQQQQHQQVSTPETSSPTTHFSKSNSNQQLPTKGISTTSFTTTASVTTTGIGNSSHSLLNSNLPNSIPTSFSFSGNNSNSNTNNSKSENSLLDDSFLNANGPALTSLSQSISQAQYNNLPATNSSQNSPVSNNQIVNSLQTQPTQQQPQSQYQNLPAIQSSQSTQLPAQLNISLEEVLKNQLDMKSWAMIQEVKNYCNLSTETEALRLIITVGYNKIKSQL